MDKAIKFSAYCLTPADSSGPCNTLERKLNPDNPPLTWQSSSVLTYLWRVLNQKWIASMITMVLTYIAAYSLIAGYVCYKFHSRLKVHREHVALGLGSSLATSQYRASLESELDELSHQILVYGFLQLPELGLLCHSTAGAGQFIYGQIGHVLCWRHVYKLRYDVLAFMFDPVKEQRRLSAEIQRILDDLASCLRPRPQRSFSKLADLSEVTKYTKAPIKINHWALEQSLATSSILSNSLGTKNFLEAAKYQANNRRLDDGDIDWPESVSARWHRFNIKFCNFFCFPIQKLGVAIALSFSFGLSVIEIYLLAEGRTQAYIKGLYDPGINRFSSAGSIALELSPTPSEEDAQVYKDFQGNTVSFLWAVVLVEVKNLVSMTWLVITLQRSWLGVKVAQDISFNAIILMISTKNKISWIAQIIGQLKQCCKLTRELRYTSHEYSSNSLQVRDKMFQRLNLLLVRAYLNYELFRRQNRPFELSMRMMMLQNGLFTILYLMMSYLIVFKMNEPNTWLLIASLACVVTGANLNLYLCSRMFKLILETMSTLADLLALCSSHEIVEDKTSSMIATAVYLWRRQLLDIASCKKFYAAKIAGYCITYELLISLNAYFIAIWLLMLRS